MYQFNFISYGESLVDFLPSERGKLRNVSSFTKSLGGAPTNLAVGLARMGEDISLLGIVGEDEFGYFIKEELQREGVNSTFVSTTQEAKTGVTFITLDENGDRSFFFFREPSADQTIQPAMINEDAFEAKDVLVLGTNLLTKEPARSATLHVLNLAKEKGIAVAMDVNYRKHLWSTIEGARREIEHAISFCNLIKLNEEEFEFLAEGVSPEDLFSRLAKNSQLAAMVITKAEKGAIVYTEDFNVSAKAPKVEVIDTTGAGDGFIAALLSSISVNGSDAKFRARILSSNEKSWKGFLSYACKAGSRVCTKLGATPGLPTRVEIDT